MRALTTCLLLIASLASSGCSGCGSSATEVPQIQPSEAQLVSIAVDPAHATKPAGTSTTFQASEVFSDAPAAVTAADPRYVPLTWSTSDPTIATVDTNGKVAALKTGVVTIVATDPVSGIVGSAQLDVTAAIVASLQIAPTTASIAKGTTKTFVATAIYSDASTADVTGSVVWTSDTTTVATIDNTGKATGVAPGTAKITATDPGSGATATATLTVTDAVLTALAVTPATKTIPNGTTQAFVATGTFSDGTTSDLTATVAWSVADATVASIDATGTAKGLAVGTTTVTATDAKSTLSGTASLTVSDAVLVGIDLTPATASIAKGTTQAFVATGRYSDGNTKDLTSAVVWSAADATVATVSMTGVASGRGLGTTTITATDALTSIQGTATLTVTDAVITAIDVSPSTATTPKGTTQAFVATATYSDASTRDVTASVTWSSSDASVANVSNGAGSQGSTNAVAVGTATITATDSTSGVSGSATVTVTSAVLVSLGVSPADPSVANGRTQALVATGVYSDGTTQDLTTSVTWSSSDATVASVSNASGSQGLAAATKVGTTTIAAAMPGTSIRGTTTLTVTAAVLVSIEVTPADPTLAKGLTQPLVATGVYSDATRQDLTTQVAWSSSDTTIASVSNAAGSEGTATAVGVGKAVVVATLGGMSGSTSLTVTSAALVSIGVTPPTPSLAKGLTQAFTATGVYTDGTTQDLTTTVAWSSSATAIAPISNATGSEGLATADAVGTATITATMPGSTIAGSTTITVTSAALVSLQLTPSTPSIAKGTTQSFVATGVYTDGTTQDLTTTVAWSTSAPSIASISNATGSEGQAQGLALGTATLTATMPGSMMTGSTTISVTAAQLTALQVTPSQPSVAKGFGQQFTATGVYTDGTTQDLTTSVSWTSSAISIATISNASGSQGLASTTGVGAATITATMPGSMITGSTTLTVTSAVLVQVQVTPSNASIAKGTSQPYTATGVYSDGTTEDLTTTVAWASSAPSIASVSSASGSEGVAKGLAEGATTITATMPGSMLSGSASLTVTSAVLVAVQVSPTSPKLAKGLSQAFVATGVYTDGSTQDLTTTVSWSSSATSVATISSAAGSQGVASGVAVGGTTITATAPVSMIAGSTTLTVTSAVLQSIQVTPAAPSIAKGTSQAFVATGVYSDASTQDLTTAVAWSTGNAAVASISNASGTEGVATGTGVGSTTITATMPGSMITGTTTLGVTAATLVSLQIAPVDPSIAKGTQRSFTATGAYTDGSTQDLTTTVAWSSSNGSVASVSNASGSEGVATGLAVGTATITATAPGGAIAGTSNLTVTAAVLTSINVTPTNPAVANGYAQQMTAIGTYSDGSTQDLTTAVTWTSSDTAVATVSNAAGTQGLAGSVAPGTSTISAALAGTGISGSTTLTVTAAVLVRIEVTPTDPTVPTKSQQWFSATAVYSDATSVDVTTSVTWSTNSAIATISNATGSEGLLSTTSSAGTVIVTATDPTSGISGSTTVTIVAAKLVSIVVTPANASIPVGARVQYTASATYDIGLVRDVTQYVAWSSSKTNVVSIGNSPRRRGVATGRAAGTVTITATDGTTGVSGSTSLTVTSATLVSIVVTPTNPTIPDGTKIWFKAMGTYSDGSTNDVTSLVSWSSSNTGIASISNATGNEGVASAKSPGATTITAIDSTSGKSATTTLTVSSATIVSIAITPANPSIFKGDTLQLAATATMSDGTTMDVTLQVTWGTSNGGVATVSNSGTGKGIVTGVAAGTANVTATYPQTTVAGSTTVTVKP